MPEHKNKGRLTMTSVSWKPSSKISAETFEGIRKSGEVEELTVSKVYIPYEKSRGVHRFRFFNTDPKNWNLFMFPYESEKLRKKIDTEHVASNATEIGKLIGDGGADYVNFATGEVATQAEIKFSKSSNLNTLYIFFYKIVQPDADGFNFEHRDETFANIDEALAFFDTRGSEFASNVPSVVSEVINAANQ
ncbi:MAG: hypothetical protein AAF429_12415 [Pseudomonadota bacterium]